tara:strand:+ start:1050 stop:1205 length:156 start_codon:yes stop_codon:yes gene_type:complete
MRKIIDWIKAHLPRWFDLSDDQPWVKIDDDLMADVDDQRAHHFGPPAKNDD